MDKKKIRKKTVEDTVCEVHKFSGYAVLSNCFVSSTKLGCSSIGLLGRVMDLPPGWDFSKAGLIAICPDGVTSIDTALNELEEWGYLERKVQMPNESPTGRIRTVYSFYEYSAKDTSIPQYDCEMETFTVENATLNRVKKVDNYTMISSKLLRNREIRNKHLGFLLKVLSLPNYWSFSMSGLTAICKEGRTAVHNAVNKLIEMGYLVRTKLHSNESINNGFEYVYQFFDVPVSKEEADEIEAETRRRAITIRQAGSVEKPVDNASVTHEKQETENLYVDIPSADSPCPENQRQYNTNYPLQKNQLLMDKSSIIPSATKSQVFNKSDVENTDERAMEEYSKQIYSYTELMKQQLEYDKLGEWLSYDGKDGYAEADEIIGFIVSEICSPLPYVYIKKTKFPREVVRSVLLRTNLGMVEETILKITKIDDIRYYQRYFISTLYETATSYHFDANCSSRWAEYAVRRDLGFSA